MDKKRGSKIEGDEKQAALVYNKEYNKMEKCLQIMKKEGL